MKNIWTILVAVVLAIILLLAMFTFTVKEGEQAVVYTFGGIRKGGLKSDPGLYFRWPSGIQRVESVDTRIRTMEVKGNEAVTTKDQNHIYVSISISWRVSNAEKYIKRMSSSKERRSYDETAAIFLNDRIRDARQTVITSFALTDFISESKNQPKNFNMVEKSLLDYIRDDLDEKKSDYGIELTNLYITKIALPQDTVKAINGRMKEERTIRSTENITEGKEEAKKIVSKASLERQKMLSQASADALRIKGEGDASAAEFYKEFKKNPELANFLRRLDTLEVILNKKATVALPSHNPLDGLVEQAPGTGGKSGSKGGAFNLIKKTDN